MDAEPQKNSYKLIWIAGASVVALAIVVGIVIALVPQSSKKTAEDTKQTATATTIDTKSDIKSKMDKVDASIKQAKTDQAAAVAALNDSKKQVKVGN